MTTFRLFRRGRRTLRRLYRGPLASYIDQIAALYEQSGHRACYAVAGLNAVDRFGRWLARRGVKLTHVNEQLIERYMLAMPDPVHPSTRGALRRLLAVLRESGAAPAVPRGPIEILEDHFKQYLFSERGLAERTIGHYVDAAHVFLIALYRQGRRDPSKWTAADVLTFVRQHAQTRRCEYMQRVCTGLRAFLRYLRFRGQTQSDLARCIPRIANWRLATLPKSLTQEQVERILARCDRYTAVGRRNYAVLMLLARLGLRAYEIRSLTLDDIDWRNGQLTIRGKGRGPEQMPMPTDVGKALSAYLANGRPPSTSRAAFVRMIPPFTQYAGADAIVTIASDAIRTACADAPCKGAHVFRHTLATQMLRKGASLREIGHVLRHRDEDTTRIYAKVDLPRLRALALPWPGGAS